MCSVIFWIIIGVLVLVIVFMGIGMITWFGKLATTTTAISYSQTPGIDVEGNNLYNDTLPVAEAQNRCSADAACAGFVNAFGDQNYYKSKMSPTIPPQPNSNSIAFTKQSLCPQF